MKVAFDENIPKQMVDVFKTLASSGILIHTVVFAKDYRPDGEVGDAGWIPRFAADHGKVIISGDLSILDNAHERLALSEAGLTSFFFASRWGQANGFTKCAMLLQWWPKLCEYMTDNTAQCWQIPFQWNWTELKNITPRRGK
ncbi:hypothetical protein [Ferrovibrio sp.]|uniref:PIN-like domain-containing protein n=1 Tax=Ferrovibrio sp. TaxID=1917215 RepID=UPI00311FA0FA